MISIPGYYAAPTRVQDAVSVSDRAARAIEWIERAHSRRPRQEFWQWLRAELRTR